MVFCQVCVCYTNLPSRIRPDVIDLRRSIISFPGLVPHDHKFHSHTVHSDIRETWLLSRVLLIIKALKEEGWVLK